MLLGLKFTLGERRRKGVVAERRQAEADYEEAIDAGHSAVLLERTADGLYTVSVGNLVDDNYLGRSTTTILAGS